MSTQSSATLEDYKKYVRELKSRIRHLTDKNKTLTDEISSISKTKSLGKSVDNNAALAIKLSKKAVYIQKIFRGYLSRKKTANMIERKKTIAKLTNGMKTNDDRPDSKCMVRIQKAAEKMGLNLEMIFRAADTESLKEIPIEVFRALFYKLKLSISKDDMAAFLFLIDEDGTGTITEEEYCSNLVAFGVSAESRTNEISRNFIFSVLSRFHSIILQKEINIDIFFKDQTISYSDFSSFISEYVETSNCFFKEKERSMLMSYFDRMKRGYIEKRFLLSEVARIPSIPEPKQTKYIRSASSSPSKAQNVVFELQDKTEANQSAIQSKIKKVSLDKLSTADVIKYFVGVIDKDKGGAQIFLDLMFQKILANISLLNKDNLITIDFISKFTTSLFSDKFDEKEIEKICASLCPKGYIGINDIRLKICSVSNIKDNVSRLLKLSLAVKIKLLGTNSKDFFKSYGLNPKHKINFSQFFIFGQKTLDASFAESSALFASLRPSNEAVSIDYLTDEIEALTNGSNNITEPPKQELESIQRKLAIETLDTLEGILGKISKNVQNIEDDDKDIKVPIDNEEINKIAQSLENSSGGVHDLLDFVISNMTQKDDQIEIYNRVISVYLDQKEPNTSTSDFMKKFKIHPNSFFEMSLFEKKIREIFGLSVRQASIISSGYVENETECIDVSKFISSIDKNRKKFTAAQNINIKLNKDQEIKNDTKEEINNVKKKKIDLKEQEIKPNPQKINNESKDNTKNKNKLDMDTEHKNNADSNLESEDNCLNEKIDRNESLKVTLDPFIKTLTCMSKEQLASKIISLVEINYHEFKHLDQIIQMSEPTDLNIMNLRQIAKLIFSSEIQKLLVSFFQKCDLNKNGIMNLEEWECFAQKAGLRNLKTQTSSSSAKEASSDKQPLVVFSNDKDFVSKAVNLKKELIVNFDLISQLNQSSSSPISILQIRRHAKLLMPDNEESVRVMMTFLKYLDEDRNSSFYISQVKLLLFLNYFEEFSDLNKENLNIKHLVSIKCSVNKIKDLIKTSTQKFNLIEFISKSIENLIDPADYLPFIRFLVDQAKTRTDLNISIDDFYKIIKIDGLISMLEKKIAVSPNEVQINKDIFNLRNSILNKEGKPEVGKLSKAIQEIFSDRDSLEMLSFVLFVDIKNENKTLKNISDQKTKPLEENKINDSQIDEFIRTKLFQLNMNSTSIQENLSPIFQKSYELNFSLFISCFEFLSISIDKQYALCLFNKLKDPKIDKVKEITLLGYLSALAVSTTPLVASKIYKEDASGKNLSISQLRELVDSKIEKLNLSELKKGNFMNKKTILNNPFMAFKTALELIEELRTENGLFEDPEFGPLSEDPLGHHSIYFEDVEPGMVDPEDVIWIRSKQICTEGESCFLNDGAQSNDVIQGAIGDCWFISALSILAADDSNFYSQLKLNELLNSNLDESKYSKLMDGVYPLMFHCFAKYGLYVFRFFKDCVWRYVIIDDRLPCYSGTEENPELIFARCDSRNEFWVSLLEKAYAKLHGTYQALISGQIDDALVDMTACVSEKLKLKDNKNEFDSKNLKSEDLLWKRLMIDIESRSMMGCSISGAEVEGKIKINGEFIGLMSGHAYAVMDLIDIKTHKLVKIRNPWGSAEPMEWNGAWSDNSKEIIANINEINQSIKNRWKHEAEEMSTESKDGTFLMEYNEFLKIWSNIAICRNFPDEWSGYRFRGKWIGESAGGTPYTQNPELIASYINNPMIVLNITKDTSLYISLSQEDGRVKSKGAEPFPFQSFIYPLSLAVFEIDLKDKGLLAFDPQKMKTSPIIKNYRDIQVSVNLPKGKYCIVPSTKLPGCEGNFVLSVYFNVPKTNIKFEDPKNKMKEEIIEEEEESGNGINDASRDLVKVIIQNLNL